jgi:hypothetical protein
MDSASLAWELLVKATGSYAGSGINHEGENYSGFCILNSVMPKKLISVRSEAKGQKGEVFHEEVSWIGRDLAGTLTLFVTSNNHPGITPHVFNRLEESQEGLKRIIFRFGNLDDVNSFREEVTFAIAADGSLQHQYAWGMPGGEFRPRSGSKMQKQA